MILKSYLVENQIDILDKYKTVLFYGENSGLQDDLKNKIKNKNNKADIINFFQEEIIKNKNILYDEINNISLFNSEKIILINEVSDKIFKEIEEYLQNDKKEIKIFLFAGILDKKSKLRNYFEKTNTTSIIACYQDNERTLSSLLNISLKPIKGVTPEVINIIINNSNLERRVINNEIEKIKIYFKDKIIEIEKLKELLNVKSDIGFEQIRDASLLGNKKAVNELISEVVFLPENIFFYINQLYIRLAKLLEIKQMIKQTNDIEIAIENLKPKIFWKDKPIYIKQASLWSLEKLEDVLNTLGKTELVMKKNSNIRGDLLLKNLIVNICVQAQTTKAS
jgi:DNA polymerase-3 subunit delta